MRVMVRGLLALAGLLLGTAAWADSQYKLLVFSIPNKYHYEYIPVARDSLEHLAKLHAFEMQWTNDPKTFEGDLKQYAAVMFLNTPGEELNPAQRAAFEAYMRGGGNAIIVHRAAITPPGVWPWYERLVGRRFVIHPMLQTAVVTKADPGFPATFGLPDRWIWSDEYYVTSNPYQVAITPVLRVDERSYDPTKIWPGQHAEPMGPDHPVAWFHSYEKGRVFVTLLGHNVEMYRDPHYLDQLMGGIYWAATGRGEAR
ncbi:ThuA domain-containing protein [Sphingomonas morindae]|uniref:ThuA domain-containing protein n=1 Tax=Sphingomonas morindae TaxID=1541170 RepID=A0ABY4X3I2_9SPHN|nr:ThuA domain-containing protein [Sphingomonas morindae]USI71451.1 ThuA domain-containing protein [Sphingomonas morindae]